MLNIIIDFKYRKQQSPIINHEKYKRKHCGVYGVVWIKRESYSVSFLYVLIWKHVAYW